MWALSPYLAAGAWVHAALLTRSARYWLLAAVYAIPLALAAIVAPGVDDEIPDWVSAVVVFWIVNAIHVWTARPEVNAAWARARAAARSGSLNTWLTEPQYAPPATPVLGAERDPGVVALLTIVTLGIYSIYWWYTVNRELRDFARTVQPGLPPHDRPSPPLYMLMFTVEDFCSCPRSCTRRSCKVISTAPGARCAPPRRRSRVTG